MTNKYRIFCICNKLMKKDSEISERMQQMLDYLGVNANVFAKKLGYARSQAIYDMVNAKAAPSYDFFSRLVNSEYSEKIDTDWLLSGKGEINRETHNNIVREPLVSYFSRKTNSSIPLIPIDAIAGFVSGDEMTVLNTEVDYYSIPDFNNKADYLIRVTGSSMYPKFNSGDIVACKKLPMDTFFQWNKVYVLDTIQGPLIKRIKKSEKDHFITLVSDNTKYDPFDIALKDVRSIALVVGVIRLE
jgi:repressor LexA